MRYSTSSLLRGILASGTCAAIALCSALPAAAGGQGHHRAARTAAPARAHYAAPRRVHYAAPVRKTHYAAPRRVHYAAPKRVRYAAPVRRAAAPARFVERRAAQHAVRPMRAPKAAPFVQYVRSAPRRHKTFRRSAASPLVRAIYASRVRSIPVVYHPRYIAGRVAAVRRNAMVIDPPAGAPIVVRDAAYGAVPAVPVGTVVTMPVTYVDGMYQYVPQAYSAPQYAYAPPMYCNTDSSSALYAALLPAVVGMLTGNSNSFTSNDVTSLALAAAAGGDSCAAPLSSGYAAPVSYSVPVTYAVRQAAPAYYNSTRAYATPFGNCLAGDEDGDETCAPASGYTYDNYSAYAPYTPRHVEGVVIGRSGDVLMVMGANGTPTFVYAAPALQSGFTVNGPIAPGQIVDAYGYYNGNTFIATALV